jgi:hypothetical protein
MYINKLPILLLILIKAALLWSCQSNKSIVRAQNDDLYLRPSERAAMRNSAANNSNVRTSQSNSGASQREQFTQNPNADEAAEYYNPNYSASGSDLNNGNNSTGGGVTNNYYGTVNQMGSSFGSGWMVSPFWGFGPGLGWYRPMPWRSRTFISFNIGFGNPWMMNPYAMNPWMMDPFWGPGMGMGLGWNTGWGMGMGFCDPFWGCNPFWRPGLSMGWGMGWNAYYVGFWNGYMAGGGGWNNDGGWNGGGNTGGNRPVVNRPRGSMGNVSGVDPVRTGRREAGTTAGGGRGNMPVVNANENNRAGGRVANENGSFARPRGEGRDDNTADYTGRGNRPVPNVEESNRVRYQPATTPESYRSDRRNDNTDNAFARPRHERSEFSSASQGNGSIDYYTPPSQRSVGRNESRVQSGQFQTSSPPPVYSDRGLRQSSGGVSSTPSRQSSFDRYSSGSGSSFSAPSRSYFSSGGGSFSAPSRSSSPSGGGGGGTARPRGR